MKFTWIILLGVFTLTACKSGETADPDNPDQPTVETDTGLSTDLINNDNTLDTNQVDGHGPAITFEKLEHDFGTIDEGAKVSYNFNFTNTGDEDLIISHAKGSCGCTVPEYPKYPIKPGQTAHLTVTFDPEDKGSEDGQLNSKTVTVFSNTTPSETKLTIKAIVTN